MKKQDYKLEIYKLLDLELDDSSLDTKIQFVKKVLIDYQKDHERIVQNMLYCLKEAMGV